MIGQRVEMHDPMIPILESAVQDDLKAGQAIASGVHFGGYRKTRDSGEIGLIRVNELTRYGSIGAGFRYDTLLSLVLGTE
jgi:hypothetical protein